MTDKLPRALLSFRALCAVATAALAWTALRGILDKTGGEPAVPLDDTYIHFQYARAWAELHPLRYGPGADPAPGATSLLWPLALAPFWAAGLRGTLLVWPAWALGFVSLGLLALETRRLAQGLTSRESALAAGAMVLAFGGLVWCAGSGMEVVPFAWLLVATARRAAEWVEAAGSSPASPPRRYERLGLAAFAAALPLMRPEGVLGTALAAFALVRWPRGRHRGFAAIPLAAMTLPPLVNWALTGSATTTTAVVKWLPASPYFTPRMLFDQTTENLWTLFGTLLDGQIWSSVFLPSGGRIVAWLALAAIAVAGTPRGRRFRGAAVLVIALGGLIPTLYDSFLWNRLRYLWPFAPAWFIGLGALADLIGAALARVRADLEPVRVLVAGGFVGALAGHLPFTLEDLAVSSNAILEQQVGLGRWAHDKLPATALIGVSDTGAVAYFSERRTFDVVGLTTAGEARYCTAGAGSRFEHYEKLERSRFPTHFIVYPDWMNVPPVLGDFLAERTVTGATILGGTTMVAYEANTAKLGSGEAPELAKGKPLDVLDVADLESEATHGYALFWANAQTSVVVESDTRADGGRNARTLDRFWLTLDPGGKLVARLGTEQALVLTLRADGRRLGTLSTHGAAWEELAFDLPHDLRHGRYAVELEPPAEKTFTALHYWSFAH